MNNTIELWKTRKGLNGVQSSMFNTHRAIVSTIKGKIIGYPNNWQFYRDFILDIPEGFTEGNILLRKDKNKPYSKENCYWGEKGTEGLHKLCTLEYNGVTKTLLEWSHEYNLNYNGVRMRYFKGKHYTPETILFGKMRALPRNITSYDEYNTIQEKRNKVSKLLSAYKLRDKKKGLEFNLTREFIEKEIIEKSCVYCGETKNVGCDRLDNSKGHTIDNVVPCCYMCNSTRNNFYTHEEMLIIGKTIAQIKLNRNNDKVK